MSPVRGLARRMLPEAVRAPIRRALVPMRDYRRARRVLQAYARQYDEARQRYRADGHADAPVLPPDRVGVRRLDAGDAANVITLPAGYAALVARMGRDVAARLSRTADCRLFPRPAAPPTASRTEDIDEVRQGLTITIQSLDYLAIDGLEPLCEAVLPELERAVFGSYVLVDKVYIYRSPVSRQRPQASWVWHYDEHPREVLKLMIYLTEVTDDTAPFTYLAAAGSDAGVIGSRTPLYGQSRISASRMEAYAAQGCRPRAATGPAGTLLLFNDNVIHRATLADRAHRDVVVLQLRPDLERRRPFVDARWTGSFQHVDFSRDPRQTLPRTWPHEDPMAPATGRMAARDE